MIKWNSVSNRYEVTGRTPFDSGTYERAIAHANALRGSCMNWGDRWLTSYDLQAATTSSNSGMNLCHQVSINVIEQIIVDYLNGDIDLAQFVAYTGVILSPSWLVLSAPRTFLGWFADWGASTMRRMDVIVQANRNGNNRAQVLAAANQLASRLNNVAINLRYGAPSTNMSIGRQLDLRIRDGWSLEPLAIVEQLYGLFTGRPVLAIESSAALNTLGGMVRGAELPQLPGVLRMSTRPEQIGWTGSHQPLMGAREPINSVFRGPIHPYLPIDRSYLGNLILIVVIAYTFLWLFR